MLRWWHRNMKNIRDPREIIESTWNIFKFNYLVLVLRFVNFHADFICIVKVFNYSDDAQLLFYRAASSFFVFLHAFQINIFKVFTSEIESFKVVPFNLEGWANQAAGKAISHIFLRFCCLLCLWMDYVMLLAELLLAARSQEIMKLEKRL